MPAIALGAENRDPAVLAAIRHKYWLDRPLPVQYVHWLGLAVRGDLGTDQRELSVSAHDRAAAADHARARVLAILIGTVIGVGAGILAAVRHGKPSDYAATTVALVGLSVPHFWLGIVMIIYFAVTLHWLPAGGYVSFAHSPGAEPRAHADAGDRARDGPVGGAHAADALVDARARSAPTTCGRHARRACRSGRSWESTRCETA